MKYIPFCDKIRFSWQVTDALREAGLETSNLIVGIDFTKSNEWTGRWSILKQWIKWFLDSYFLLRYLKFKL